jgi:hypothetical protein
MLARSSPVIFLASSSGYDVRMATKKSTQSRKTAKTKRATAAKAKPKAKSENSKLVRPIEPMPAFVRTALGKRDLLAQYRARPDYQRNDYLRWIAQAKREATQRKRLEQMLDELDRGDVYMNMAWRSG